MLPILPMFMSVLGSSAAGSGLLGAGMLSSPLIAGAAGSALGTGIQTGDPMKALGAGLTGYMGGALAGNLLGGAGSEAITSGAESAVLPQSLGRAAAVTGGVPPVPPGAGPPVPPSASGGMFDGLLSGTGPSGMDPTTGGILQGNSFGDRLGQIGTGEGQHPFGDVASAGFAKGTATPAGIGAAVAPPLLAPGLYTKAPGSDDDDEGPAESRPYEYDARPGPGPGYKAGVDAEHLYFDPRIRGAGGKYTAKKPSDYAARYAAGGVVRMANGGLAEMPTGDMFQRAPDPSMAPAGDAAQPNEKDLITLATKAITGEVRDKRQAAMILAKFVEVKGPEALDALVKFVKSGKSQSADGRVVGPGDGSGTDDLVTARGPDGGDVLLSENEYVLPERAVAMAGGGSVERGVQELDKFRERALA